MGKKTGPKPKMDGIVAGRQLIGERFGNYTVLQEVAAKITYTKNNVRTIKRRFLLKCDCGTIRELSIQDVTNGDCTSCGCMKAKRAVRVHRTHGMSKTSEYSIWSLMKRRCLSPKDEMYEYYGGRGIKVCDRWLQSFENFFADMGTRPSLKHSLDRFPNKNGDYEPSNCRWATDEEQSNNSNSNVILDFLGEKLTMKQVSKKLGLKYTTLISRLKSGWAMQKIIDTPLNINKRR